ncbi:MAG TPA: hypothetical protein DCZ01_08045 [Elusimicrobia bacterium]|nr:MAG: hypothetical protein A2X37_08970 [Elusimicrobia bacterium GWA2_66_18]OGR68857.1 MAG: hypothetical protein A2X40_04570 [Elusimicrobia bacterium GWC2_65_9]HAZ08455.1 hypothetical protein [Elusimicrobiota bacterium]
MADRPAAALFLMIILAASASSAPSAPRVALDPPPGWTDATAETTMKGLIMAYRGPESSSFVLVDMPPVALDNPAAARSYLTHVLAGLKSGSKLDYRTAGKLETKAFRNGLTAQLLRAQLNGRPRLVLAAFNAGGRPVLATLSSSVPDAMLTPLLGSVRLAANDAVKLSGRQFSQDGQLEIALGGGLSSRAPTPEEMRQGVVLAVQGSGAEVVVLKLAEEGITPKEHPAVVRATVADALKIPLESVSAPRGARTPAGPAAVYAWAKVPGSADLRFAAGFLPWGYWGYSLLARGPLADDLLVGVLSALTQGPSAVPGLVAASPKIGIPRNLYRTVICVAFILGALLVFASIAWRRSRGKANLPS